MSKNSIGLLRQILSIPTMSFHEEGIATFVRWYAAACGLNVRGDRYGNLLVFRGSRPGGVVFSAHMDHPGFEVVGLSRGRPVVALWGKVDPRLCAGARVVMHGSECSYRVRVGSRIPGKQYCGRPLFYLREKIPLAAGDFGHFALPSARVRGATLWTRAADNLMGVAAILDMFTRGTRGRAQGLFTRGEEAGFLGAFGAMESGLVSRADPLIVLECSSAQHACVEIGDGPVIRVGDFQSSYDPLIERWIHDVAGSLAAKPRSAFRFQRQLLPGGRCEACVYTAHGYRAGGIALPLGNYHNQGPHGPAMEYISLADYERMVLLMCELARVRAPGKGYLHAQIAPMHAGYRALKRRLVESR